jgi:hypothetical protein
MVTITKARNPITVADLHSTDWPIEELDTVIGARRNIPEDVDLQDGFLGFTEIRPATEAIPEVVHQVPPEIYALKDEDLFVPDQPISFSPIDGKSDTIVIPRDIDLVRTKVPSEILTVADIIPDIEEPKQELVNREPTLVYKVLPKVPPSAEMMGIGGHVDVLLLLGPDGNPVGYSAHAEDTVSTEVEYVYDVVLKDGRRATLEFYVSSTDNQLMYVTLEEEPKEFKFAEYLYQELPKWKFSPAIRDSKPVYAFVRLRFNYCAPGDVDCQAVELNPS